MLRIYHLLLPLICFVETTHAYNASGLYDCPPPWIGYLDNCYRFVNMPQTIAEAKATCSYDGAHLVAIHDGDENDFVIHWLMDNAAIAADGNEWFIDGVRDPRASAPDGSNIKYTWESDGTEVAGLQFWFSIDARQKPGNRIVYYSDGAKWGWSLLNDTTTTIRPFVCEISKDLLYMINTVDRGFDFGVNETGPMQLEKGPIFVVQPEDAIYDPASLNKSVVMNCEADANPLASYVWFVDRAPLPRRPVNLTDPKIMVTRGRLMIDQPSNTQHDGDYQCVATNSFGSILSNDAQLNFGYLNDFPKSRRDPVQANARSGIGIECLPPKTGYSTLTYAWFKDTIDNFIDPDVRWYMFVSYDGKLFFQLVTLDDEGDYYCVVKRPKTMNNFLEDKKISMPIPLRVVETVGGDQEPIIVNSFPKSFPSSPLVGDDVRVECLAFATSVTQMSYWWNRTDGKPMPSSANFSDYNRVMFIPNIQLSHAGRYQCSVSRQLGQSTYGEMLLTVEATPYFTMPLSNMHVDRSSTVRWQCVANGVPAVTYKWYVNATVLNTTLLPATLRDRFRLANNVLTITNVQPSDAGMYQCSASNAHGTRMSSAQLRVLWFPPTFQKFPIQPNTYGTPLGDATLLCNPESAPPSTKVWLKNGSPLNPSTDPSERIYQLPNGNLHLTQLQTDDGGNYTCEAENTIGKSSSTGQLTILPMTSSSRSSTPPGMSSTGTATVKATTASILWLLLSVFSGSIWLSLSSLSVRMESLLFSDWY